MVQHHLRVGVYREVLLLSEAQGARVRCRRHSSKLTLFAYHQRKQTTRVDVGTLRRKTQRRRSLTDTPSTRALSRTEQASVSQQRLVQRMAAVEREAEGYQEEECRCPSWHQR